MLCFLSKKAASFLLENTETTSHDDFLFILKLIIYNFVHERSKRIDKLAYVVYAVLKETCSMTSARDFAFLTDLNIPHCVPSLPGAMCLWIILKQYIFVKGSSFCRLSLQVSMSTVSFICYLRLC